MFRRSCLSLSKGSYQLVHLLRVHNGFPGERRLDRHPHVPSLHCHNHRRGYPSTAVHRHSPGCRRRFGALPHVPGTPLACSPDVDGTRDRSESTTATRGVGAHVRCHSHGTAARRWLEQPVPGPRQITEQDGSAPMHDESRIDVCIGEMMRRYSAVATWIKRAGHARLHCPGSVMDGRTLWPHGRHGSAIVVVARTWRQTTPSCSVQVASAPRGTNLLLHRRYRTTSGKPNRCGRRSPPSTSVEWLAPIVCIHTIMRFTAIVASHRVCSANGWVFNSPRSAELRLVHQFAI